MTTAIRLFEGVEPVSRSSIICSSTAGKLTAAGNFWKGLGALMGTIADLVALRSKPHLRYLASRMRSEA